MPLGNTALDTNWAATKVPKLIVVLAMWNIFSEGNKTTSMSATKSMPFGGGRVGVNLKPSK